MRLCVRPSGNDRYVVIQDEGLGLGWEMQFPEVIRTCEGVAMAPPDNCGPVWRLAGPNAWGYTWRTTPAYTKEVAAMNLHDSAGNPLYANWVTALEVRAAVAGEGNSVWLQLAFTNEFGRTLHGVYSDGGCLQAKSQAFIGNDEVHRSHVMAGGRMVSMADLPRTIPLRCSYRCFSASANLGGEWFWGRSSQTIDCPAIVGAVSSDGRLAIAVGYQGAIGGQQNSDNHHCLHSMPWFGDIDPGETVARRGVLRVGMDIQVVARSVLDDLQALPAGKLP